VVSFVFWLSSSIIFLITLIIGIYMSSKSFDIYNFYCAGEQFKTVGNTSYLGLIEICLPEIGIVIIETQREYMKYPNVKAFLKTGLITITLNEGVNEPHSSIAKDICSLLSFAMNGHVEYRECITSSSLVAPSGMISHGGFRQIIINRFGKDIRHFIESCWELYRQEKDRRRLFETIRLLIQTNENEHFIEQKIALTSVMLENLKHTYASHNENYIRDKHQFYIKPKVKGNKYLNFRKLLTDMISDVNLPCDFIFDLSKIINNRNNIIHQGLLNCSPEEMGKQYVDIVCFIRVYLLSLLEYKGHYYSFDEPNVRKSMNI